MSERVEAGADASRKQKLYKKSCSFVGSMATEHKARLLHCIDVHTRLLPGQGKTSVAIMPCGKVKL